MGHSCYEFIYSYKKDSSTSQREGEGTAFLSLKGNAHEKFSPKSYVKKHLKVGNLPDLPDLWKFLLSPVSEEMLHFTDSYF